MARVNGISRQTMIHRLVVIKRAMDRLDDESVAIRATLQESMKDWESADVTEGGESYIVTKDVRETRILKDNAFIAKEIGKASFLNVAKVSVAKLEHLVGKKIDQFVDYTKKTNAIVIRKKEASNGAA